MGRLFFAFRQRHLLLPHVVEDICHCPTSFHSGHNGKGDEELRTHGSLNISLGSASEADVRCGRDWTLNPDLSDSAEDRAAGGATHAPVNQSSPPAPPFPTPLLDFRTRYTRRGFDSDREGCVRDPVGSDWVPVVRRPMRQYFLALLSLGRTPCSLFWFPHPISCLRLAGGTLKRGPMTARAAGLCQRATDLCGCATAVPSPSPPSPRPAPYGTRHTVSTSWFSWHSQRGSRTAQATTAQKTGARMRQHASERHDIVPSFIHTKELWREVHRPGETHGLTTPAPLTHATVQ
jgi:hypothetical protein